MSPQNKNYYLLDWQTFTVHLEEPRYSHEVKRPTTDQQLDWLKRHFSIDSNPTFAEGTDAKLYDEIFIEAKGYEGSVPSGHKSAVISGLYDRDIILHEICRTGSISVLESFSGFEVMMHTLRVPTKAELTRFPSMTLRSIEFYDLLLERVDGVKLRNGDTPTLQNCITLVHPSVKLAVLGVFLGAVSELLAGPKKAARQKRDRKKRRK